MNKYEESGQKKTKNMQEYNPERYPLVSIVTPCYNGDKYLDGYFQGVLTQSYPNIELIFVNDGSLDETEKKAKAWGKKLEERKYRFVYIYQENAGIAAAINQGLKCFTGEYFTWLDSDDIMLPENIERKVDYLENHPEHGFVFNEVMVVDETNPGTKVGHMGRKKPDGDDKLFEDYIKSRNVVWVPGTILVRRRCLLDAIPERKIYESREGQNWQLMLPLSYLFTGGYIEEELLKCVKHSDSHSRAKRSMEEKLRREENFIKLCSETVNRIPSMDEEEKEHWKREIRVYHNQKILDIAVAELDYNLYRNRIAELKNDGYQLSLMQRFIPLIAKRLLRGGYRALRRAFSNCS